ncbi:TIGR03086 family metal-binding protein [Nocardioides alcanivorans]|uniref:TIGR03086 family metal-binding protein n=1 Tax=Nocardioides alcanivorans TaxID=2897352 RepID=UPI001F1C6630|nr:TIGR03086 family metal-binding protein [Nocardioides alcanivorans]
MTTATAPVALLERAVGFTRQALYDATSTPLSAPTPCPAWQLGDLLEHMADGLEAFTEASSGFVSLEAPDLGTNRLDALRGKACALLSAWSAPTAHTVLVHDQALHVEVLLRVAAVEITVHGWDVSRAAGTRQQVPDALAHDLLPAAHLLLESADRPGLFAPALEPSYDAGPGERLLARLGRRA